MSPQATTTLKHFALVNFKVNAKQLRPLIPSEFDLDQTESGDFLVSAVPFYDTDFRFPWFPWVGFKFWQINYRAYVIERSTGTRGVWFFKTDLGSPLALIPRWLWKLPWHYTRFDSLVTNVIYRVGSTITPSDYSVFKFIKNNEPCHLSLLDFELLTNPMQGFYYRRDGKIGTYEIEHPEMELSGVSSVWHSTVTLFQDLGLINIDTKPHSVYLAAPIEFKISLPPRLYNK